MLEIKKPFTTVLIFYVLISHTSKASEYSLADFIAENQVDDYVAQQNT